jgi:hypothetical protein
MAEMLEQLQSIGIVEGQLSLEKRTSMSSGQVRHFIVPRLSTDTSPMEILSGNATVSALSSTSVPALEQAEVIDVELVDEVEGWDIPPVNTKVRKNPNPPPRFIPA